RLLAKHVAALWQVHDNKHALTMADSVKIRDLIAAIIRDQGIRLDKEFFVTFGKCLDGKCTPKILTNNLANAAVAMLRTQPNLSNAELLERLEKAGHTVASKGQIRQLRHDLLHATE